MATLRRASRLRSGFALVVVLSLMVLLTIIAVGLLTLGSVSLRTSTQGQAMAQARANARMALMLAIGQVQKLSGADTRITASSTLMNQSNVQLTGVWRSWEGSDRDSGASLGKPVAPNYPAKRQPGDSGQKVANSPTDGRFLGWLASAELPAKPDTPIPGNLVSSSPGGGKVMMLGPASVAQATEQVHILPSSIGKQGRMAWWTSGENSKAMVNTVSGGKPTGIVEWQQKIRSYGRPDPKIFDLEAIANLPDGKFVPDTPSLDLIDSSKPKIRRFHDLSAFTWGLLTNTATGGWRRDLSLMTESYDGEASSVDTDPPSFSTTSALPPPKATPDLPFYTAMPGKIAYARKAIENDPNPGALLYPWAAYRNLIRPEFYTGPISSWTSLVDYAMQYKQLRDFSASATKYAKIEKSTDSFPMLDSGSKLRWSDKIRCLPMVARVHMIFSLASQPDPKIATKYQPRLMVTPIVTLWNPYSVELEIPAGAWPQLILWHPVTPMRFKFKLDGKPLYMAGSDGAGLLDLTDYAKGTSLFEDIRLNFPNASLVLPPGGSKLFSITSTAPITNRSFSLVSGYQPRNGFLIDIRDLSAGLPGTPLSVDGAAILSIEEIKLTGQAEDKSNNPIGVGPSLGMHRGAAGGTGGSKPLLAKSIFGINEMAHAGKSGKEVIEELWPGMDGGGFSIYQGQIRDFNTAGGVTYPFAAAILALRGGSPLASRDEPEFHHQVTKGLLQTNPLCYYMQMGRADDSAAHTRMAGTGVYHPANSPYEFGYRLLNGWNDSAYGWVPQTAANNQTYIVTGLEPYNGLTRCVMAEIPTRPLQSLADLQHWDARNNNPVPPFQFNLIGNGSATPVIPPDAVSVKGASGTLDEHMCNDDSYLLNHVLFDDWFISSIAPDYGNSGVSQKRGILKVYEDHLTGAESLPNRFYLPTPEAQLPRTSDAAKTVTSGAMDAETRKYPFETIASKLQVTGMFNVNSVSLDAWRALLRQGRDVEVPYLDKNGRIQTDAPDSISFPRTSIAGDRATDSGSQESGTGPAVEYTGHRVLTDSQIDALAKRIVEQIRLRGPFLSLSEFVNRQLSVDKNLALAGTIQRALDKLAESGSAAENPFKEMQANSISIEKAPPGRHDYNFPEAALGSSAFGMPGWIRQADILRPLAPVLSARDDTFTIRAYGDVRDPADSNKVLAKAWCEAVVARDARFVDATDDATVLPFSDDMKSEPNRRFGRKYRIVSFRWLHPDEI